MKNLHFLCLRNILYLYFLNRLVFIFLFFSFFLNYSKPCLIKSFSIKGFWCIFISSLLKKKRECGILNWSGTTKLWTFTTSLIKVYNTRNMNIMQRWKNNMHTATFYLGAIFFSVFPEVRLGKIVFCNT